MRKCEYEMDATRTEVAMERGYVLGMWVLVSFCPFFSLLFSSINDEQCSNS